jgi:outer membrane protein TolC
MRGADDALHDTERTLNEALAAARRRYLAALENLKLTGETLRLAQKDLQSDQQRLQSGAIARTALEGAHATALEADLAEVQALLELWQARIALLQAAGGEL